MSLLACACTKDKQQGNEGSGRSLLKKTHSQTEAAYRECSSKDPGMAPSGSQAAVYHTDCLQYELFGVIGRGHSNGSSISLSKHVSTGSLVAIKRVNLEKWDKGLWLLQHELVMARQLSHPNILPFHCCFITQQELWAVMPLMAFGSCRDLMQAYFTAGLPELVIILILREVLQAVAYLHDRGIIHRGITGSHVLVSQTGQVCLSGLHNSYDTVKEGRRLHRVHHFPEHTSHCVHCFSPELLEQNLVGYNYKSDIYSVGILACELANGQSPFSDLPATQMLLEKLSGTKPRLADSTTVSEFVIDEDEVTDDDNRTAQECADDIFFKRTFSPHLHTLSSVCLERDPLARPTATELLAYPVFKSVRGRRCSELPALLEPVTPLTDIGKAPPDVSGEDEEMSSQMSQVSMLDEWTF